jgi:tellurite resistance protein TerC
VYKGLKKVVPISNHIDKENFFVKRRHITATPLFVALVVIEVMDVVFAIDSVPLFWRSRATHFSFSSNIFAILGLRSMYFF